MEKVHTGRDKRYNHGKNLHELRKFFGFNSLDMLAEATDIPKSTLSDMEKETDLSDKKKYGQRLDKIARVFNENLHADFILNYDHEQARELILSYNNFHGHSSVNGRDANYTIYDSEKASELYERLIKKEREITILEIENQQLKKMLEKK